MAFDATEDFTPIGTFKIVEDFKEVSKIVECPEGFTPNVRNILVRVRFLH